ncbi:hypothetical protein SS50377_21888 [Spironucleus salmonicida]|uniref:Uncharacterized protein n=1 Tax=Spironucleus salmonicida TaxID=348837 RepID=V6LIL1_9EUKA|nr:hypothetical protein SS50377_21888 [Spironucleus salmonicida]|eukprot:EST44430.1 Hypothetical protein SS50377_15736 [Spironucleus salmonicida]
MTTLKQQFIKTQPASYDPKAYTKFLEQQLENFNEFQLTLNSTTETIKTLNTLHIQQEERISAQTRLISLMQQVLEKQNIDYQNGQKSFKIEITQQLENVQNTDITGFKIFVNSELQNLKSQTQSINNDYTFNKTQIQSQLSDIAQNIENLQNFARNVDLQKISEIQNGKQNTQSVDTIQQQQNQKITEISQNQNVFEQKMKQQINVMIKDQIGILSSEIASNLGFEIRHAIDQILPKIFDDFQTKNINQQLPPTPNQRIQTEINYPLPLQTSSITSETFKTRIAELQKPLNEDIMMKLQSMLIEKFDRETAKEIAMEDLKNSTNGIVSKDKRGKSAKKQQKK